MIKNAESLGAIYILSINADGSAEHPYKLSTWNYYNNYYLIFKSKIKNYVYEIHSFLWIKPDKSPKRIKLSKQHKIFLQLS